MSNSALTQDTRKPTYTNPLIAFLVSATISRLGNFLASLAIPWFVLATTGSATNTALTVAIGTIPLIVTGVLGGTLVDRFGYWRTIVVSEIASGISTLMIPILHFTIGIEFWHVMAFAFLGALLDSPGNTARRSLYPKLVEHTSLSLDRANAIYMITGRVASLIGAPLAGILIAYLGAPNLLFVTTTGFFLSTLLFVAFIPGSINTDHASTESSKSKQGYLEEIRSGFRFIYNDKVLFWMILCSTLGSFLAEPIYGIILQVYVQEKYGSAEYLGYIFAGLAIGSLFGNFLFAGFSERLPRRGVIIFRFLVRALAFVVFIFVPPWWAVALAIFIGAVALEPVNPLSQSIMQERVPPGMRGKVFGVTSAINASTFPVGIMIYGFLLDALGLETTLMIFVVVNFLVPIALIANPYLKQLNRQTASAA